MPLLGTNCLAYGPLLSDAMVGDVNLFFNDPDNASVAEIDIMIAEPGCRGRGLGTEAVTLMMHYGTLEWSVCVCVCVCVCVVCVCV